MAKQKLFLVLDTETAAPEFVTKITKNADERKKIAIAKPLVYDFGYVVVNASGKFVKRVNYLIEEVYCNEKLFNTAYYAWKRPLYEKMLQDGKIIIKPWMDVLKEFATDLNAAEIATAFNACFDFKKAISYTCDYIYHLSYKKDFKEWIKQQEAHAKKILDGTDKSRNFDYLTPTFTLFKKDYPITDLWTLACNHLAKNKKFKYFCLRNNRFTNSVQYYSTTAETIFQYYTKDIEFNEEHTALSDAEIEAVIFVKLLKGKELKQEIKAFPFRALGNITDFAKDSPKYREKVAKALKKYLEKNNAFNRLNEGYWAKIVATYDEL